MRNLSTKETVLLIGVMHPNEQTYTFSRQVSGWMDEEDAITFMKAEAFLEQWGDTTLDDLLVVDKDLNVRQLDLGAYIQ